MPAQRVLTETDYHPFIHLRSVLHAIFEEAGYRLVSAFVDSAYFDSLYMSGNYPTRDATLLRSRMDFLAARFGEAATTADSGGRVCRPAGGLQHRGEYRRYGRPGRRA